tara:strand:- start:1355 stop:1744 length:390 start_codon:yes stop_codon:yes gene_type:complete
MATTSSTKDATAFDVSKYTISSNTRVEKVTIEETGDTFEVTVKPLSWAKRNQLLSDSLTWNAEGTTGFNSGEYMRACLREMIVDAPWGKTNESFLISIDERLGKALEKLVPQAFAEDEEDSVENVKKEP